MTSYFDEPEATLSDYYREAYGDPCPTHGTLRYGGDCPECEAAALAFDADPETCLCAVCRQPVRIPDPGTVDHFIYEFDGELNYIELLHRACAERAGYAIDAEGHIGLRPEPKAAEPVTCPVCGSDALCDDGCPAFILNDWIAEQVAKADYNNQFSF